MVRGFVYLPVSENTGTDPGASTWRYNAVWKKRLPLLFLCCHPLKTLSVSMGTVVLSGPQQTQNFCQGLSGRNEKDY